MKKLSVVFVIAVAMTMAFGTATAEQSFDALVMISELDFYAEPSYDSEVLDTLIRMEEFTVCAPYRKEGDFVYAKVNGVKGWIPKNGMKTIWEHIVPGTMCVVYTSPRCIFSVGSVEAGEELLLIEEYEDSEKGGFYVVLTDEGTGFISKKEDAYILEVLEAYQSGGYKEIDAKWEACIYSQPDLESAEIGRVEAGESLKVVSEQDGYLTIVFGERYGYVRKYHVQ